MNQPLLHFRKTSADCSKKYARSLRKLETHLSRQEFHVALKLAQRSLGQFGSDLALHKAAWRAAHGIGREDLAMDHLAKAIKLDRKGSSLLRVHAQMLLAAQKPELALEQYLERSRAEPGDAHAHDGIARCLFLLGAPREALDFHAHALQLDPKNPFFLSHLGHSFEALLLRTQAQDCFESAHKLDPGNPDHEFALANCLYAQGSETASDVADNILARDPDHLDALILKGKILISQGLEDAAGTHFLQILTSHPDNPQVMAHCLTCCDANTRSNLLPRFLDAINSAKQGATSFWLFTLAQALAANGVYEESYKALCQANAIDKATSGYDLESDRTSFIQIRELFSAPVNCLETQPRNSPTPIFVVGLPRSGSTLTEQILAAHPDVSALGESPELNNAIRQLDRHDFGSTRAALEHVQNSYLCARTIETAGTRFVLDKNLGNFRYVGHIIHAFPGARIIHQERDIRANCWSLFWHGFNPKSVPFTNDPEDILGYAQLHKDMMDHWKNRWPDKIITLDYEALVGDPEHQIRHLLDRLDIDWHDGCLAPEKVQRMVTTASKSQVTRKIYTGSSQTWRKFEPWAGTWLNNAVSKRD